ncbi:MAG TPA: 16S rRNA (cytosine(1402)-N(4))-methyltransferase RsmH [Acidimicrobiales bacterium]
MEDPYSARFHLCSPGRHPGSNLPVEGLRMSQAFAHEPVMTAEIVAIFAPVPPGTVLDATVGGGGHAAALLAAHPQLRVVGLDRDPDAAAAAAQALAPWAGRVSLHHARFDRLSEVAARLGLARLSGALFDLGVSSPQLDRPERGFSYRNDAPLDMRMDPTQTRTATDVVNGWAERDLASLLRANGEGRFGGRIARAIVAHRPVTTTVQLAAVVRDAIPAATRRTGGHPARRAFQAIRIAVNDELDVLPGALDQAIDLLAPGGRIAVLAYHSGEDRIVKDRFRTAETGGCECPPGLPCACGAEPRVVPVFRGVRRPGPEELGRNRRAESARLRAAERLETAR